MQRSFDILPCLLRFEPFRCNDSRQFPLFLPHHKVSPLQENIFNIIDSGNEVLNQSLFAPQLRAGVYGFPDGNQNLFIVAVRIVILFYQQQNIVNIDLDLPDQLYLKDNIIINIGAGPFLSTFGPLVFQILIPSKIVLQIPLRQNIAMPELIEGRQNIPQPQYRTEKRNEIFLILLSNDLRLRQRKPFR